VSLERQFSEQWSAGLQRKRGVQQSDDGRGRAEVFDDVPDQGGAGGEVGGQRRLDAPLLGQQQVHRRVIGGEALGRTRQAVGRMETGAFASAIRFGQSFFFTCSNISIPARANRPSTDFPG